MPPAAAECRAVNKPEAILLIGPTGSGKTPLGELLERRPLWGRLWEHFDFGAQLRLIAAGAGAAGVLAAGEAEAVATALAADALLEDAQFPIAEKILRWFLADRGADGPARVVLNGLPRHAGQAQAVESIVEVQAVVRLNCPAEVAAERIRLNAGGERTGREDDNAASVAGKFEIFLARTAPMAEHYRQAGARIETLEVGPATRAEQMLAELNRRGR